MGNTREKYRILFLEAGAGMGGSTVSLISMLEALDKDRFQPYVGFYFSNTGPDTSRIRELKVSVIFFNEHPEDTDNVPFRFLLDESGWRWWHTVKVFLRFALQFLSVEIAQLWRLVQWIRKEQISLIVLNNDVHYHLVGMLAARITRTPVICRKAGGIGEGKRIKPWLTPWVELFICISKATADDQEKNNPGTKRQVALYQGVDVKRFRPLPRNLDLCKELGIQGDDKCVGYISRVVKGKGQSEFIDSAALIIKEFANVKFLIVGAETHQSGLFLRELQSKVRLLGLENYIFFLGWRQDIPALLSVIDVFVHCPTTWIEGLCISAVEAMAMGKPMVVSNNGGLTDTVIDGVTGFIVQPWDIRRMAEAIVRLLKDEDLAANFGKFARERAEKQFDGDKDTHRFEMLCEMVCEEYALKRR